MPAAGEVRLGERDYAFAPASSFGGLDWGRGNWTYANRWYWGSASGLHAGAPFGFNIGYGFSDRTPASENMLFYKNRAHKLGDLTFEFDSGDYMRPWRFRDEEGRFELDMQPLVDRKSATDFLLIKSIQHQVFGSFSGFVVLDDGLRLDVDGLLGFAEDVLNRW